MSKPPEATRHYNSTKLLILLPSEPFSFVHFNMIHPVLCSIQDGNLCSFQVALVLEEWFSKTKDDFTSDQDKVNSVILLEINQILNLI